MKKTPEEGAAEGYKLAKNSARCTVAAEAGRTKSGRVLGDLASLTLRSGNADALRS